MDLKYGLIGLMENLLSKSGVHGEVLQVYQATSQGRIYCEVLDKGEREVYSVTYEGKARQGL